MDNAFELVRRLWVGAQLAAPSPVQQVVIPRLHAIKELARLLTRPHLPVYELTGQGKAGPLRVSYIGLPFAKPVLETLLFVEKTSEVKRGAVPFWKCSRVVESLDADIVVVSSEKHLIHHLPRRSAFTLPEFVHHVIDVRGSWDEVLQRIH